MSKVETTIKVSLKFNNRMNLGRRGARAPNSMFDIVHKLLCSRERVKGLSLKQIKPTFLEGDSPTLKHAGRGCGTEIFKHNVTDTNLLSLYQPLKHYIDCNSKDRNK